MALILLSALFAGLSVFLVARVVIAAPPRTSRRLAHLVAYQQLGTSASLPVPVEAEEGHGRGLHTLDVLGERVTGRFGGAWLTTLRTRLRGAGMYDTSPERFVGAQVVLTGACILLAVWMAVGAGLGVPALLGLVLLTGYVGFAVPVSVVSRRSRERLAAIDRELPELVDLLVVAVEAGLGLGASLARGAEHTTGPLADELRLVMQEQSLGATPHESLGQLVERNDSPAIRSFVRTLTQGEQLGVPVGQTMRAVALDMRKRRRAAAEELAQKAPIKIMFPLVFCIFPSLLVVILAPAALQIAGGLGA